MLLFYLLCLLPLHCNGVIQNLKSESGLILPRLPIQGAAVAYVADMFSTPAILLKAVTDIVDGDKPTAEEFLKNLISVTAALDVAATKLVDFICGKRISDL
jgi:hypothetical protein